MCATDLYFDATLDYQAALFDADSPPVVVVQFAVKCTEPVPDGPIAIELGLLQGYPRDLLSASIDTSSWLTLDTVTTQFDVVQQSVPVIHQLALPTGLELGHYVIIAKLDPANRIVESDESNNLLQLRSTFLTRSDSPLIVEGTPLDDVIILQDLTTAQFTEFYVDVNGGRSGWLSPPSPTNGIEVRGYGGNDTIVIHPRIWGGATVNGGEGDDRIVGGEANEMLIGGAGKDQIDGRGGNDRLNGNGGNDKLFGGAGADRLYGYDGNDYLDGGSSADRLEGGDGSDTLLGQSGNDRFFTSDTSQDHVFGGSGNDSAHEDVTDLLSSIEA